MNWIKRLIEFFPFSFALAAATTAESRGTQEAFRLLADYFAANGGVGAVLKRFEAAGFAGKVRSWTAPGPSLAINSVEALQLIGWKDLRALSHTSGIPVGRLRDLLAEALPAAVGVAALGATAP